MARGRRHLVPELGDDVGRRRFDRRAPGGTGRGGTETHGREIAFGCAQGKGGKCRDRRERSRACAVIIVVNQCIRLVLWLFSSVFVARAGVDIVGSGGSAGDLNNVLTMLSLDGRGSGEARFVMGHLLRGTRKLLHHDNMNRRTGAEMRRFLESRVRGAAATE